MPFLTDSLGPSKAMALPAFHASTRCDTALFGKGKKSVWQSMPELTLPLQLLSGPRPTTEMISTHTLIIQKCFQKLYVVSGDDIRTVDDSLFTKEETLITCRQAVIHIQFKFHNVYH